MTRKVYKSAMGKDVDLGALLLQNEHVRAVGNMNVNARGDILDSANRVIEPKTRQAQKQYRRTTSNVSADATIHSGTRSAKQSVGDTPVNLESTTDNNEALLSEIDLGTVTPVETPTPVPEETIVPPVGGGLAAAIARSRIVKQEKEKTLKEKQQAQGLRKI